jgi:hypothetical protein
MSTVLFVTQTQAGREACGIGLMGNLVATVLVKSTEYKFEVIYTDEYGAVEAAIKNFNPVAVIYNYSNGTSPWMNQEHVRAKYNNIPHIKIHHDMHQGLVDAFIPAQYGNFPYLISDDPTLRGNDRVFITQRIIPAYTPKNFPEPSIPTIGFQGFGPPHKGIYRIAQTVQNEFDEAILRLHISPGLFGDPAGNDARKRVEECRAIIRKPGIKIVATHTFVSNEELIDILAQNTINCYFFDYLDGCGLASSPDFALAARKPIAITRSHQFRNLWNLSPSICIEQRTLRDIIQSGLTPLLPLYEAYTEENLIKDYTRILHTILKDN